MSIIQDSPWINWSEHKLEKGTYAGGVFTPSGETVDFPVDIAVTNVEPGTYRFVVDYSYDETHNDAFGMGATASLIIQEPLNEAHLADAGPDRTIEATGATTPVTLDGTASSDPDGDALTYLWSNGATTATPTVNLAPGTHTFSLTVTDPSGESDTDSVTITVADTTGPTITSLTPSKDCLWPPNHQMETITLSGAATDNSGGPVTFEIVSVTSSEPDNGLGDGDKPNDIEITGPMTVKLRVERSGTGPGRTYTITVKCTDASGNVSYATTTVCVPHDMGKK